MAPQDLGHLAEGGSSSRPPDGLLLIRMTSIGVDAPSRITFSALGSRNQLANQVRARSSESATGIRRTIPGVVPRGFRTIGGQVLSCWPRAAPVGVAPSTDVG